MIRNIILSLDGKIPTKIFFKLLEMSSKCKDCLDGYLYPIYGVAPHLHDIDLENNNYLTKILPKKEYPDYYDDTDNGCGIWYCKNKECCFSKDDYKKYFEVLNA